MRILLFLLLVCTAFVFNAQVPITPFETNENTSATYAETIEFFQKLSEEHAALQLREWGRTDVGLPLHTVTLSLDGDFDANSIRKKGKRVILINNGIHAGEPCGIDATMLLIKDYLKKEEQQEFLDDVVLVVIPLYNIGGALMRNSTTRTNQNGPEEYGFRGNAKHLDLNRDFLKCDSKNAMTFNQIFTYWKPDVFVDTHTSNGADYPYTITLISSQEDKLSTPLRDHLNQKMLPDLYRNMKARNWEMTPYVYSRSSPEEGIAAFLDLPRYSTGYGALHQSIGFTVETHMLKPFKDRVNSTFHFLDVLVKNVHKDSRVIAMARERAVREVKNKQHFNLSWEMNFQRMDSLWFKGYKAKSKPSKIGNHDRLYYDRSDTYEKYIPFVRHYTPIISVEKPLAYLIPQAYSDVLERLKWNGVQMAVLNEDLELELNRYYIKTYETTDYPYEGHYLHSKVEIMEKLVSQVFHKGDVVVFLNQEMNEYIIHALEPQATDSFFAWNFFDGILMQKEYFSSYVFEDLAVDILKRNPEIKAALENKQAKDAEFADNPRAQLKFIYERSEHYEPSHNLYPVARIMDFETLRNKVSIN